MRTKAVVLVVIVCVAFSGCVSLTVGTREDPLQIRSEGIAHGYLACNGFRPYDGNLLEVGLLSDADRWGNIASLDVWPIGGMGLSLVGVRAKILPFELGLGVLGYKPEPEDYSRPRKRPKEAQTVTTEVYAKPAEGWWNDTGLTVGRDDRVTVRYISGRWRPHPNSGRGDGAGRTGSKGDAWYVLPNAPDGSLIGKVGGTNTSGGSNPFHIGNKGKVPSGLEGTLWLTTNDGIPGRAPGAGFSDNTGSITVEITVE